MSVRGNCHRPVLRIFVKYTLQIRHIIVNVLLQSDNSSALAKPEQVGLAKSRCKDKIRQGINICHKCLDFVAPLAVRDRIPLDMYVGLFFQALEDRTILGFRCVCRIIDQTSQSYLLSLRKSKFRCIYGLKGSIIQFHFFPAACRQGKYHARRKRSGN